MVVYTTPKLIKTSHTLLLYYQPIHLIKKAPQSQVRLHVLTNFWPPGCVDLALGGAGCQAVTRRGWTQLGVPAVLQDVVAVHALDGEELWATQDVDHIVPEDSCGIPALLKGAADICPAGVLRGKPHYYFGGRFCNNWCEYRELLKKTSNIFFNWNPKLELHTWTLTNLAWSNQTRTLFHLYRE